MEKPSFFGVRVVIPLFVNVALVIVLILLAGTMAGLILCVFSLDAGRMKALLRGTNTQDAERARKVLMILKKPHWLLITILIWNDIALEMLPVVLNMQLHPFAAIAVAVVCTLVFSEIVPQAVFIHHTFALSAFLAPFIYALMWVSAPIAWPISLLLDAVVGDKKSVFLHRRQLRELIRYQEALRERKWRKRQGGLDDDGDEVMRMEENEDDLTKAESTIMLNALILSERRAKDILSAPIETLYRAHIKTIVTKELTQTICSRCMDFIAVYEDLDDPTNVTHVFQTRSLVPLIFSNEEDRICVQDLPLLLLERCSGEATGAEVLAKLQRLSPPIVILVDMTTNKVLGLLTLRDVMDFIHRSESDPAAAGGTQQLVKM